jgi:transcriptional regulator with XRE-family HTH domain
MESLTDKIKRLRKSSGITQIEVANSAGITQSGFASIEKGNTKSITIEVGIGIAKALGVPFYELFDIEIGNSPKEDVNTQLEDLRVKLEELRERISEKDQLIKAITNQNKQLKAYLLSSTFLDHWAELSKLEYDLPGAWDENEKQGILRKIDSVNGSINHDLQHLISVGAIDQSDVDEFIEYNKRFSKRSFEEHNEASKWLEEQVAKKTEQLSKQISPDQSAPTIP